MPTARFSLLMLLALPVLTLDGCRSRALDRANLSCSAGACLDGYVCHPETDMCVPAITIGCTGVGSVCPSTTSTGDPCPVEGSFIPCTDGATGCDAGCRTCTDGAWSACSGGSCTLGLPATCSACDDDCTVTVRNATVTCNTSGATNVCSYTACDADWYDADLDRTNGCECQKQGGGIEIACNDIDEDCVDGDLQETGSVQHCADCADDCSVSVLHAAPVCDASGAPICDYTACTALFADADGSRENGCECGITNLGVETCDGLDNDCNGTVDDVFDVTADCNEILGDPEDVDAFACDALRCSDGHCCVVARCAAGTSDADNDPATGCEGPCEPTTPADEICDGLDNDCDGNVDNPASAGASGCTDYYFDADGDTFGVDGSMECWCGPAGMYRASRGGDCDDDDDGTYTGAPEVVADGTDQSCDGADDCYEDTDDDGLGSTTVVTDNDTDCTNDSAATATVDTDCDDTSDLCTTTCDDLDSDAVWDCRDDCIDGDGDGFGVDGGSGTCTGADCDDTSDLCTTTCDDLDSDTVWDCRDDCIDGDRDGYGVDGGGGACAGPDCDDANATCTTDCTPCQVCTPSQPYCDADGRTLEVCLADGTGPDVPLRTVCDYICEAGRCVAQSNVADATMSACGGAAPVFDPPPTDTVTITPLGIACSTDCGGGSNFISGSGGSGPTVPLVVCVASARIPSGLTIRAAPTVAAPVILLSDGDVTVAGTIRLAGADGAAGYGFNRLGGPAGPGGGDGGDGCGSDACTGNPGVGRNPDSTTAPASGGGEGGSRGSYYQAGGGGGGGFAGTGGGGGNGPSDTDAGAGGGTYGSAVLQPLLGGSGGGAGGDGRYCNDSGPGGGGGGAIQITSRGTITITGEVNCSGGAGGGSLNHCSAGGGGSGGSILLEARSASSSGRVVVDGGTGGSVSNGGAGGAGATAGTIDGVAGASDTTYAGGGGGGGGGRVRINSLDASPCANVSPAAACTTGAL